MKVHCWEYTKFIVIRQQDNKTTVQDKTEDSKKNIYLPWFLLKESISLLYTE